ncbi:MAG: hypothetical protein QOH83_305, partial [Solirubrobacteraceae bacterium]|nr:hypothetical protein [Solirubrobacteraceae bacterium]
MARKVPAERARAGRTAPAERGGPATGEAPGERLATGEAAAERSGRRSLGVPDTGEPERLGRRRSLGVPDTGDVAVRRIQPQPPAPPAAPAGALGDETERPIGIRHARRPARPIVTPPGDTPAGGRRRRRSIRGRILPLVALAILAVVVIGALMLFQPFGSAEGSQVQVSIPSGSGARQIGDRLAQAGVVDSGLLFSVRAALSGKRNSLLSGRHTMRKGMTYGNAIAALSKPDVSAKPPTVNITIPEGRTRREVVPIAKRAGLRGDYLEASRRFAGALSPFRYGAPSGTRSLEGFLFPATYELKDGAPARDLVERQLAAFRTNFARVDLGRARRKQLTAYDVLIIASMVEREAQRARERPLIAAVIYNRLKDGIPLGIDATTRYALNKPSGALTQSELQIDSRYNTRKRAGLPPTPIGNPGLSSIRAAAAPANVKYRYFVVKPGTCGEHAFSNT